MKLMSSLAILVLLAAPARAAGAITVSNVWSRPAVDTGVVYLTIHNHGTASDRLIDATSTIAHHVEMHQTTASTQGAMGGMSMGSSMPGMAMEMRRVRAVAVPAEGSVAFAPGGYHVMLIGLQHPLMAGQSFTIRLHFARAGWVAVRSQVRGG